MILWLNGTFGVGKTTTADALLEESSWRVFDPEHVGYLVAGNLRDLEFDDFQELDPWRSLVPAVASALFRFTRPAVMVAVQTVLVEDYWRELMVGFVEHELPVFHVVLDCEEPELRRRIETDQKESDARAWRLGHLDAYQDAKPWLTRAADLTVNTTDRSPQEVAAAINRAIG